MSEQFKEQIYDLMIGALDLKNYPIKESLVVTNEYEVGKFCEKSHEEVYNAKCRLCERLGVDEDEDVELIIDNLLKIGQYLSMKMFDYGIFFSSPSIK